MNRKTFTKTDFKFIITLLFVASLAFILLLATNKKSNKLHAEIIYKGSTVQTVNLYDNKTFSIKENPNVVFEVKDGSIKFLSSDCPDKICVKTGFVNAPWQIDACLPNDIIIKIVGDRADNTTDVDTVVQ